MRFENPRPSTYDPRKATLTFLASRWSRVAGPQRQGTVPRSGQHETEQPAGAETHTETDEPVEQPGNRRLCEPQPKHHSQSQ